MRPSIRTATRAAFTLFDPTPLDSPPRWRKTMGTSITRIPSFNAWMNMCGEKWFPHTQSVPRRRWYASVRRARYVQPTSVRRVPQKRTWISLATIRLKGLISQSHLRPRFPQLLGGPGPEHQVAVLQIRQ